MRKDSAIKFNEFYSQDKNFDVLFLGTSHVMNGVSPMDLWKEYGIVSYNLATPGCRIATSYWTLKNALRHTSPKLVVIDCAYLYDEKVSENTDYNHRVFDSMPLDDLKVKAIFDLYEKFDDRFSYIFPFSLYHERWTQLDKIDFEKEYDTGKMGFEFLNSVTQTTLPVQVSPKVQEVDNISTLYLEKIIMECKEKKIDVLFTFLPFNVNKDSQNDAAYIRKIAEKFGIHYLSPDNLLQVVNTMTDFANNDDNNSHLNLSGAHKISYYLGKYIADHYKIPDQRKNSAYILWNDYYKQYSGHKISSIQKSDTLDSYLMLIADRSYNITINFDNPDIIEDKYYINFFKNIGIDVNKINDEIDSILIWGLEKEVTYLKTSHKSNEFNQTDGISNIHIVLKDSASNETVDDVTFSLQNRLIIGNYIVTDVTRE